MTATKVRAWQDMASAPHNVSVLLCYRNRLNNWRIVRGCYHTELTWQDEYDFDDGDDARHQYCPAGWYEGSEMHETLLPLDHDPLFWMPLPAPPLVTQEQVS